MRTFEVKYSEAGSEKVHRVTVDALNSVSAKRQVQRGNVKSITVISVEDVTGPQELKDLLRF